MLLFFLLLSTPPLIPAQQIYKWKDERGQWHFSNAPPHGEARPIDAGDLSSQLVEERRAKPQARALSKETKEIGQKADQFRLELWDRLETLWALLKAVNPYSVGATQERFRITGDMDAAVRHYKKQMASLVNQVRAVKDPLMRLAVVNLLQKETQQQKEKASESTKDVGLLKDRSIGMANCAQWYSYSESQRVDCIRRLLRPPR